MRRRENGNENDLGPDIVDKADPSDFSRRSDYHGVLPAIR
jgi:hypothetical protein